ncbi:2b0ef782-b8c3-421f-95a8-3819ae735ecc [Thermothielavioides terrestris]|uniref:Uncharacterized protein n=2 Tax=Thermothielavioides terrestris TaxID=2587410 RepID=G2QXF8_THETT|nr:uncharacterized protein THITE_2084692 [Thermothielavioides terrestris NRRL 8126]AEO63181.1 hypothetical protein THITE_2084692 [Thermothielavioides terrestris NRRL 8126]SPQ21328.1 2b0ef782-b8c3-421f-95a8-3819ae735ecc [Thermothielavioides terrestris]
MKLTVVLATLGAAIAMAAPNPGPAPAAAPEAEKAAAAAKKARDWSCLPPSCQVSGCDSGNCAYWCEVCGVY